MNHFPSDLPSEEEMNRAHARYIESTPEFWAAIEATESIPEALKYHPLIIHTPTEAQLRACVAECEGEV